MTSILIAPLALPRSSDVPSSRRFGTAAGRRRLTLAQLRADHTSMAAYDYASIDKWGRVVARRAIGALDWLPGTPLAISDKDGLILVQADAVSRSKLTSQGNLRLPAPIIWQCGLRPGTRMLVVANPAEQRLIIHPPAALDEMVAKAHSAVFGGGVS